MNNTDHCSPNRALLIAGVVVAALLLLVGLYLVGTTPYINDDGFIHARIARNLADAGYAYFNLDSPANASSSPLFTLILAGLFTLFGAQLWVVQLWNALMVVSLAVLLWRRFPGTAPLRCAIALLAALSVLPAAADLMETPTAILLFVAGVLSIEKQGQGALGLLTLAAFTRPECGAALLIALLWQSRSPGRSWGSVVLPPLIVAAMMLGWLYLHFGAVIPQSIIAKSIVYEISPRVFWEHVYLALFGDEDRSIVAACILIAVIGVLALKWRELPRAMFWLLGGSVIITVLSYRIKSVLFFPWYAPLVSVPLLLLLGMLASRCGRSRAIAAICIVASLPFTIPTFMEIDDVLRGRSDSMAMRWGARVQSYRLLGQSIQRSYPGAVVMMAEIGGFGWEFKGTVLDAVGLATPEALRFHPMKVPEERVAGSIGAIPAGFIEERQPDFVIGYPQFLKSFSRSGDAVAKYCQYDLHVFPRSERARMSGTALWGNRHLFVYVKRSLLGTPLWMTCPWPNQVFGEDTVAALSFDQESKR